MINKKTIIIGLLKPLSSLDEAGELLVGVGKANVYVIIAGIVMIVLGKIFHALLNSMIAIKETIPEILEYNPEWLNTLSSGVKEQRELSLKNRIKRESLRIRGEWMAKWGTKEAIDDMLKKAREKESLPK